MHRRSLLAGISSFAALTSGCTALAPPGTTTERVELVESPPPRTPGVWPQIGYDPHHTRHVPDAPGPRTDPEIDWRAFGDHPITAPVIDDRLVIGVPGSSFWTGELIARNPGDGETEWTNTAHDRVHWPGALFEETVLVIEQLADGDYRLSGVDTGNGETRWTQDTAITASSGVIAPAGPTIRDELYYIASHLGIIAGEAETGEIEWNATLDERVIDSDEWNEARSIWAKPCVTDQYAITTDVGQNHSGTKAVLAVDRTTGDEIWTAPIQMLDDRWAMRDNLVVGGGLVFVNAQEIEISVGDSSPPIETENRLYAIEADTGDIAWDIELDVGVLSQLAYADGSLYGMAWDREVERGRLLVIDGQTGAIDVVYEAPADNIGPPVVGEEMVYVPLDKGIAAFETRHHEMDWHLHIDEMASWTVLVNDRLYVQTSRPSQDGELIVIEGTGA